MQSKLPSMVQKLGLVFNLAHYSNIIKNTFIIPVGQASFQKEGNQYLGLNNMYDCIGVMLLAKSPENKRYIGLVHYNAHVDGSEESLQQGLVQFLDLQKEGYQLQKPILLSKGYENSSICSNHLGSRAQESVRSIERALHKHYLSANNLRVIIGSNNAIDINGNITKIPLWYNILSAYILENQPLADKEKFPLSEIRDVKTSWVDKYEQSLLSKDMKQIT